MTPNGWRHSKGWHYVHYFRAGRALCGAYIHGGPTKPVGKRQRTPRCVDCRDLYAGQWRLFNPQAGAILDLIDPMSEAPMG
jgi:hypothetical protein